MHEFLNFEAFHALGLAAFKRPLDPLLVFCHYVIVQNEFKFLRPDAKKSELLPAGWNELNEEEEIHLLYEKRDGKEKIRVEAAFEDGGRMVRLTFRKLIGAVVSHVYLKIADYINEDHFRSYDHSQTFKQANFYKLFIALMHGLAKINATAQPFALPEPPADRRLSVQLDKYAYESQDEDQAVDPVTTDHLGGLAYHRTFKIGKRKRKSLLGPSCGAKKRRLSRQSNSNFPSTERDPLSIQDDKTLESTTSCPETLSDRVADDDDEEDKPPMAAATVDHYAKHVTPKKAEHPGGPVTLTSWFKKLTPPSSAERLRQANRSQQCKTVHVAVNPITNYYSRSSVRILAKSAQHSDIKLLSKCLVQLQNIFPHGIGRATVNNKKTA